VSIESDIGSNVLDCPLRARLHLVDALRSCQGAPDFVPLVLSFVLFGTADAQLTNLGAQAPRFSHGVSAVAVV